MEPWGDAPHEKIVRSRHVAGEAGVLAGVVTETAGRMIFIAGHTGQIDDAGKSLAADFDAQFRQTFRNIEKTLAEAGGTCAIWSR